MKDNDAIASLLAVNISADKLLLLSDVEGVFSGDPSEPNSRLLR